MRTMLNVVLVSLLLLGLFGALVILGGCTAEQAATVEKGLTDANDVATGSRQLVEGPAGSVLPKPISDIVGIGAIVIQGALLWWMKNKNALTRKAAGAVVQAIEQLPADQGTAVKAAVGEQMAATAAMSKTVTYSSLNGVIDSLKV